MEYQEYSDLSGAAAIVVRILSLAGIPASMPSPDCDSLDSGDVTIILDCTLGYNAIVTWCENENTYPHPYTILSLETLRHLAATWYDRYHTKRERFPLKKKDLLLELTALGGQ